MSDSISEQILEHHGVKGQRWGVRRKSKSSSGSNSSGLGHPKHLSDDDLKKLVARLQLEKQFKELTAKQPTRGQKFRQNLMEDAGRTLFKIALNATVGKTLKDTLEGSGNKATKQVGNMVSNIPMPGIPNVSVAPKIPTSINLSGARKFSSVSKAAKVDPALVKNINKNLSNWGK